MRHRIVLDTSVLIAGLRSRRGASFEILRRLGDGTFQICMSVPIVVEYESIVKRQAHQLGLTHRDAEVLVDYLCSVAEPVDVHFLWRPTLPDPDDDMLLEAAVAGRCNYIVTHNIRDFRGTHRFGVRAIIPGDFLMLPGDTP